MIDPVKVSERAKNQLITLKKRTGIENWNVLCRYALTRSVSEPSVPPEEHIPLDSNIEMSWKTFGGEFSDVYEQLVRFRVSKDYPDASEDVVKRQFYLHLHRGISYLMASKQASQSDLVQTSVEKIA